jgi:hypothetical protein
MKAEIEILPHSAYFIDEPRGGGRDAIITAPTQHLKKQLIFNSTLVTGLILSYQPTFHQEVAKKYILGNTRKAENASIIEMHCRKFYVLCFRKTSLKISVSGPTSSSRVERSTWEQLFQTFKFFNVRLWMCRILSFYIIV